MNEAENKYLVFTADEKIFMMNFEDVQIIIPASKPEEIPDFPDYVRGTVVNGDRAVTVIDLRRRFGYAKKEISDRDCIIICTGEKNIGLLCDSITGFIETAPEDIQPPPDVNEQANARFISGTFLSDGEPRYIIKPELIIKQEDEQLFQK